MLSSAVQKFKSVSTISDRAVQLSNDVAECGHISDLRLVHIMIMTVGKNIVKVKAASYPCPLLVDEDCNWAAIHILSLYPILRLVLFFVFYLCLPPPFDFISGLC